MAGETDKMLRGMAQARGFKLVKSRRRKPGGDFGRYGLADAETGKACFGFGERGLKASPEEIEEFLRGRANANWKSSLSAPESPRAQPRRRSPPARTPDETPAHPQSRSSSARPASARKTAPKKVAPKPPKPTPEPVLVIREVAAKDAAGIVALMEASGPTPRKVAAIITRLVKEGKPPLVADQDGIVGAVSYDVMTAIHRAAPLGRITFLATAKGARRRGIGSALLQAAETRLRKLGCRTFELVNDIELSNANSFLRRHAYQRSGYRFARDTPES